MANAKVCDRCGKIYAPPVKPRDMEVFQSRPPHLQNEFFDLCDECTEKLRKFMRMEEFDVTN